MVTKKVYKLSAFAKGEGGGNLAGVVIDSENLSESEMQAIAKEVGYSETAFVSKSERADFKVRFFTPNIEVDLCGHATIATFNLLKDLGFVSKGVYTQETKAGILKIEILESGVYMEQRAPEFDEIIKPEEIIESFYSPVGNYINNDLPVQVVSTGLREIFMPVKSLELLNSLTPHNKKIIEVCKEYNALGIHAFSLETITNANAHTRNFAPLVGIDEESATGTANGALACYINRYINPNLLEFTMEQGYSMGRPSEILIKLKKEESIIKVMVGGKAKKIEFC